MSRSFIKDSQIWLRAAKAQGLYTQAFTNGLPLTREEKTRKIIHASLDSLRFSVGGATQSTYENNRVGGKLDHALRNMKIMVEEAKNTRSDIRLSLTVYSVEK